MFIINLSALEELIDGSQSELKEILKAYIEVSSEFIAFATQNGPESITPLGNSAHKLRSLVHLVGLEGQAGNLAELERLSRLGVETQQIVTLKNQILALAREVQEQIQLHIGA